MCRSRSSLIEGAKKRPRRNLQAEPHRQTHSGFATESPQKLPPSPPRRKLASAGRGGVMVPTDRISLDKTILLPACGKHPLTPVSYLNTADIRAGAAWSIRDLLSMLLNEIPASGGQKFHDPADSL